MTVVDETASLLDSLRGRWDEPAVDDLDHALQSAARAVDDGADDELTLAAALHDVGHSPLLGATVEHDRVAREWLTPRFGERVGWLAGAHVAAKRYLSATEPGYGALLSDVSVASLHRQGGAAVDPALVAHHWWPDALRLRRYDDAAKDPNASGLSVVEVLALAERLMRRQELP